MYASVTSLQFDLLVCQMQSQRQMRANGMKEDIGSIPDQTRRYPHLEPGKSEPSAPEEASCID
jgi:hypothetical protein